MFVCSAEIGVVKRQDCSTEGKTSGLILIEGPPGRLQRLGILPTATVLAKQSLGREGVPEQQLTILDTPGHNNYARVRRLGEWLEEHPGAQIMVVCDRFASRTYYHLFCSLLSPQMLPQIHLRALPNRYYDETNWWKHKEGMIDLLQSYLCYGYSVCHGDDSDTWREWDPDEYETRLP
jgi:hypothetical protein